MSGYVIIVDFRIMPGRREAFRALIDVNARASIGEAGCRRFDVVEPVGDEDRIVLYEIYDDRAAFDVHLASEHYAVFDRASAPLVAGKTAMACILVVETSAEVQSRVL